MKNIGLSEPSELSNLISERSLPNLKETHFVQPIQILNSKENSSQLFKKVGEEKIKILLLYGSLRERSYSKLVIEECARLLHFMGAEVKIYNPQGLPQVDTEDESHPKVKELRDLVLWSDGQVWCSPERHGAMTSILKSQIDWIPLSIGAVRPSQGKTLAILQVSGGSQSFNALNQMRILGRWMRMFTIPNQSSVPKAFLEFEDNGRMKPSSYYDRIVDVMEELVKITLLLKPYQQALNHRYSETVESAEELRQRVNQRNI